MLQKMDFSIFDAYLLTQKISLNESAKVLTFWKYFFFFRMVDSVNYPACGILRDRTTLQRTVVIGCGRDTTKVQFWDLESNEIFLAPFTCPDVDSTGVIDEDGHFDELNDNYLIFTNSQTFVYRFDLENGFVSMPTATSVSHHGGDSFVAPRGTVECTGGNGVSTG